MTVDAGSKRRQDSDEDLGHLDFDNVDGDQDEDDGHLDDDNDGNFVDNAIQADCGGGRPAKDGASN